MMIDAMMRMSSAQVHAGYFRDVEGFKLLAASATELIPWLLAGFYTEISHRINSVAQTAAQNINRRIEIFSNSEIPIKIVTNDDPP